MPDKIHLPQSPTKENVVLSPSAKGFQLFSPKRPTHQFPQITSFEHDFRDALDSINSYHEYLETNDPNSWDNDTVLNALITSYTRAPDRLILLLSYFSCETDRIALLDQLVDTPACSLALLGYSRQELLEKASLCETLRIAQITPEAIVGMLQLDSSSLASTEEPFTLPVRRTEQFEHLDTPSFSHADSPTDLETDTTSSTVGSESTSLLDYDSGNTTSPIFFIGNEQTATAFESISYLAHADDSSDDEFDEYERELVFNTLTVGSIKERWLRCKQSEAVQSAITKYGLNIKGVESFFYTLSLGLSVLHSPAVTHRYHKLKSTLRKTPVLNDSAFQEWLTNIVEYALTDRVNHSTQQDIINIIIDTIPQEDLFRFRSIRQQELLKQRLMLVLPETIDDLSPDTIVDDIIACMLYNPPPLQRDSLKRTQTPIIVDDLSFAEQVAQGRMQRRTLIRDTRTHQSDQAHLRIRTPSPLIGRKKKANNYLPLQPN